MTRFLSRFSYPGYGLLGSLALFLFACGEKRTVQTPPAAPRVYPACEAVDNLRQRAFDAYAEGEFGQAETLQRQTAALARSTGCDPVKWVKARCNMAHALRLADPENGAKRAIDSLKADLAAADTTCPDLAGIFHFWIADTYLRQLDFFRARPFFENARLAHEKHGVPITSKAAHNLYKPLASIYTRLGENEKAIRLLRQALDTCRASADLATVPQAFNDLGLAFFNAGRPDSALRQYALGWAFLQKNTDPELEKYLARSDLLANWAQAWMAVGRPDSARATLQQALELDPGHPTALLNLSKLNARTGNAADAFLPAEKAIEGLTDPEALLNRELGKALLWRAELRATAAPQLALADCQAALQTVLPGLSGGLPDPHRFYPENTLLEALDLQSRIHWQQYRHEPSPENLLAADTATALALQMTDTLIAAFGFESSQLASLADARSLHERYLQILFEQHRRSAEPATLARVVAFSEKSRANLLRRKLAGQRTLIAGGLPDSLAQRERLLRESLIEAKTELAYLEAEGAPADAIDDQRQIIFALDDERNGLLQRLRDEAPLYYNRQYGAASASLAEIRTLLPDDNALLVEYFYNPDSSILYTIGIGRQRVELHRNRLKREDIDDFMTVVKAAELGLNNEGDPAFQKLFAEQALALYDTLLRPVTGNRPPATLILIPDGMLGGLPFDALLTAPPASNAGSFREMPYLLRSTRVRLAPSATVLLAPRHAAAAGQDYLGIAATYPEGDAFDPVAHGESCVKALARQFGCQPVTGEQAVKSRFKREAPHCSILHFYGHGKANHDQPGKSFLAFSGESKPVAATRSSSAFAELLNTLGAEENLPADVLSRVILAQEISLMQLSADLTVLSACQTGVGPAAGGEGIFSLARAFQEAGCPSVAMTLWEVNDAATADMTRYFLEKIRQGMSKDEALQQAKLYQLDNGTSAIPYFWSGFVLTGDARPVDFPQSPETPVAMTLALAGLIGLIAVLLWAIFKRG